MAKIQLWQMPHDCLATIASFCCPKALGDLLFSCQYYYQLIKDVNFWINKSLIEEVPIFINDMSLQFAKERKVPYINYINAVYWTKMYEKAIESYKNAYNTLVIHRCEQCLGTSIIINTNYVIALTSDMSCYQHDVEKASLNWVNKIIIKLKDKKYKLILYHYNNKTIVHQEYNEVLYLLSYFYSKDATIADYEGYSFIKNCRSIRRTIWKNEDLVGDIKH